MTYYIQLHYDPVADFGFMFYIYLLVDPISLLTGRIISVVFILIFTFFPSKFSSAT